MYYQQLKEVFNNTQTQEKLTYLILFLFPIAGPVVRHWNSFFFLFITFLSFYFLITNKNRKALLKQEKILLSAFGLFFVAFIITANLNGWSELQTVELGNELMFFWFIPIYLLIREHKYALIALFAGILLSVPVVFLFSLYEYYHPHQPFLEGAYSQLFLGPILAMTVLFYPAAYKVWFRNKGQIWIVYLAFALSLFVITFTYARTAYLTLIVGIILLSLLYLKRIKSAVLFLIISIAVIAGALSHPHVNSRVMVAIDNVSQYFTNYDDVSSEVRKTSLGLRLEMWRASQYAIKEHPLFGIAPSNFPGFIEPYIQSGAVNEGVRIAGTLHNTFVEVIVSKGIFGLILFLIILYYPVYIAWNNRHRCKPCFQYIVIFSVSLTSISMGLSNIVNKNNAVSYLVFFTAVLFSFMMRQLYSENSDDNKNENS
ncbi:MAG: O-antigen ligase family protein [Gammaproteobacteria bacterium]|nr:O-antigen ligase family protein [Gammaproteobacteria bacterium]